jgi:signal transduction histidine kinase
MYLPQRTARSFSLILATIVAVAIFSIVTLHERESARARTAHALNVLLALDDVAALMRDAEANVRGNLLTDGASYRAGFLAARRELPARLLQLEELTRTDAGQHAQMVELAILAQQDLAALSRTLEERELYERDSPLSLRIADARQSAEAVLTGQLNADTALAERSVATVLVGSALLLAFAIIASLLVRTDFLARATAEAEADLVRRRLERTNAELDRFAHVVSHDLKAPLRGITQLTGFLEEEVGLNEKLQLLRERAQRLEGLVDGILAYSRAGQRSSKVEQVDAERVVADTVELLAPPTGARVEKRGPLPVLHTERVPFQQVWMNLVGNALKYSRRADPVVELSAHDAGHFWDFAVKDNGPGIAKEDQVRIWDLFHPRAGGHGIGLSVVKKIVEAKGGRAWVESAPGDGATFHFTWPKQEA